MRCLRCGNQEERYFYRDQNTWYCRKCIAFGRVNVNELPPIIDYKRKKLRCEYTLNYPLTQQQKIASQAICNHVAHHQSVLVYAVCGAGKTELVMEVIKRYLNQGKKVGFAISRRQVVLEIQERMQKAFPSIDVSAVCEGYTKVCDGDLIICTMHQLYRYVHAFDLMIMDEVDAFPYCGNEVLKNIAQSACIGEIIYLTATPDEEMLKETQDGQLQLVELFQRPHGYPLVEPTIKVCDYRRQLFYLIRFLCKQRKTQSQTLVFVPTIAMTLRIYQWLHFWIHCKDFSSQSEEKEKIIQDFRDKKYECLITTTVLERGITIKGVDVVILCGDHGVFNEASLTQILGRVGRSMEMPTGKGVLLCNQKTKDIKRCLRAILKMNEGG